MNSTTIRVKALELVDVVRSMDTEQAVRLPLERKILVAQALAIFEVAAQLAELNERLSNITSWGANGLALRVEKTP